jgi:hypothetical protein
MQVKRIGPLVFCFAAALAGAETASLASPPAPEAPTPLATPTPGETPPDAKSLFAKAVEALGGREKIAQIRDVRTRGQVTAKAPSGEMTLSLETTMVFPDRLLQQMDGPFGRFAMVTTPESSYVLTQEGPRDLPGPMREELLRQIRRTALFLAQKIDDPNLLVKATGEEKVGETPTRILEIAYADIAVRWYVDPASGRIRRTAHEATSPTGKKVNVVSDFSDFKTADGINLPHHIDVATDGSPDQVVVLEEVAINPGFDPKIFVRPAVPTPAPTQKPTPVKK